MDKQKLSGTITFIQHEKHYATIEYVQNGKTKTINGNISEKEQQELKKKKLIKKAHTFHIGDDVTFVISPSAKGDKMVAELIEFRFNNAFSDLIHKAATENRFSGYLKKVDDRYFVKESGSYILFPLVLSPWEIPPHDNQVNETIFFKFNNIDKPAAVTASLFKSQFIPEYKTALDHNKSKKPADANVTKITPFGIFITLFNGKIQAKIPTVKEQDGKTGIIKTGDVIKVLITYINPLKIVVEKAN